MNFLSSAAAALILLTATRAGAITVRILAWDQQIAGRELAITHTKGEVQIQDMHPSQRTKAYQVSNSKEKPAAIMALDKLDDDGKPTAARIKIPEGMKQPLLILLPDPKAPSGLRIMAIEDNSANFPWSSIRLINTTGKKLAFTWEKKLKALPPSWTPIIVKPGGASRNMEVQVFLPTKPKRPIYSAIWEQRQDFRTLAFIVPGTNPRLGPIAFKIIHESRAAIEAPQTADAD